MKTINTGIIGLGIGEQHLQTFLSHNSCRIKTICDFNTEKMKQVSNKYNIRDYTDNSDHILNDPEIELVSICSYDNYHYEQIVQAITNNKHVFIEKPFVLFKEEALHIRKLLKQKPHIKLSSNLILRKSPRFLDLRNKIEKNEFGKIYHIDCSYNYGRLHKLTEGWRGKLDFYSVIYGGGVHVIDLALWLVKNRIKTVQAQGNSISTKGSCFKNYDMVTSVVKFENEVTATINSNFSSVCPHFHKFDVYGTKGIFSNDYDNARLYSSRDPDIKYEVLQTAYPGVHKGELLENFIDTCLGKSSLLVSTDEIFESMSVCFAMEKSVKTGESITVEYI